MNQEPKIINSELSQEFSSAGATVHILIYRLDIETEWALEIEDEYGNSTTWDDSFESESFALAEAKEAIHDEGIESFIGPEDGKGEWR